MTTAFEKAIYENDEGWLLNEQTALALQQEINGLINNDFNKLVQILYRLDVSEIRLKTLLQQYPQTDASKIIATLIIERQLQKIKSRQQFACRKDDSNEEKW